MNRKNEKPLLISSLINEFHNINDTLLNKEIFKRNSKNANNEFLFILKPELFINTDQEQVKNILTLIFNKLEYYQLNVNCIRIQNAHYFKKYEIFAQHYGVINKVARNIRQFITDEALSNFKTFYNVNFNNASVYGALELLETNIVNIKTLNQLWKDCNIKRLGSGIYCGKVKHNGNDLYIINGFHPPQLQHFITNNRIIITLNLSGKTDWSIARKELIGNTYPEKASKESIRGALYKLYRNFGFENVSYVINSVHLSAGPLEGLIELIRFNSAFEKNEQADMTDFSFGKLLLKNFTKKECEIILTNPTVFHKNKAFSLFDHTEEMNSNEAIELLKEVYQK